WFILFRNDFIFGNLFPLSRNICRTARSNSANDGANARSAIIVLKNNKTTQKRWFVIAIGFVLMAIIFVYFYAFSPFQNDSFFPYCVFKATTGLDCVGCGGQRAVHELL